MEFSKWAEALNNHFQELCSKYKRAFVADIDKDVLWQLYLDSFPEERNKIYRVRREFDCSHCKSFIRAIGRIVFIDDDYNRHSIWDFEVDDKDFQHVMNVLNYTVCAQAIQGAFLTKERTIGCEYSREYSNEEHTTWHHFYVSVPASFDGVFNRSVDLNEERGKRRDDASVFDRSLREISLDAIDTVLEIIDSNTLYRGQEWKTQIEELRKHKMVYKELDDRHREAYAWKMSATNHVLSRIRNHSIGVLLTDISSGMDLDAAVTRYEKIVAPANYKRPKAIFTQKMLKEAEQTVNELGYMESLGRRFATLDDINVTNILFSNKDAAKRIAGSVFAEMAADAKTTPKSFDRVEEIGIDKFISDVLPHANEIEAYVENKHSPNLVSLIAPAVAAAPSMFKWGNAFSWCYTGNIADSDIRTNVKNAGGRVNGDLRFSIQWNDGQEWDQNDVDAHCRENYNGIVHEIYYGDKYSNKSSGQLDVDIRYPIEGKASVENIVWPNKGRMPVGRYLLYVHCYTYRGGTSGFRAEIAINGETFNYDYQTALRHNQWVEVAIVTKHTDGSLSIEHKLPHGKQSKEMWGVKTETFVPVSTIMYSPNYWDQQSGIGHRHVFFMLKDCKNNERTNGFYNEFLKEDLMKHKRVFEALGSRMRVEDTEDQLSGLGFSTTKRNDLVVRVKGATNRLMKIKF